MTRRLLFGMLLLSVVMLSGNAYAWLSGWDYRRPITIDNSGSSTLTDFQVKITVDTATLISEGKMNSDCSDMRFTDESDTELPYWIESGCNTSETVVWVKVPSIPTSGTTIYMYYGNGTATDAQDPENVFEFFDDFSTDPYSNGWTATGSFSTQFVSDGDLITLADESSYAGMQKTLPSPLHDFRVFARVKVVGSYVWVGVEHDGLKQLAHMDGRYDLREDTIVIIDVDWTPDTEFHKVEFTRYGNTFRNYLDGTQMGVATYSTTKEAVAAYVRATEEAYFDYIAIAKYVEPEPTASVGAEETQVSLTHTPTEVQSLALDPDDGVNSVTVEYNAALDKQSVVVEYYRAYDADSNATIVEGTDDVDYVVFQRTYSAVGDYNTCVYVRAVDGSNNEYEDTACDVVHIDQYPQALSFDWNNHIPFLSETLEFNGEATDNGSVTYSWNFGDGNTDSGQTVQHAYSSAGTYTVTLTVTDDVGLSKSVSKSVAVYAEPELNWTPATPHAQEPATFTIQYDDRLSVSGTEWNIPDSVTSYWYDTQSTAAFQHYGVHTVSVSTTLSDGTEFRDVSMSADVNVIPIHIALRVKDEETLQDFNVDHLGNNPSIDVDLYTQDGEYYPRTITETGQTVSWDLNSLVDHITVRYSVQGQPVFRQYYFRQPYYDLDFNAYMPDATVSQTLQMTFKIEDQTGQFDDPLLIIERYSDDQTIEVLSAKKDAEGKIVAYLISGAEYTLSVWQDGVEKSLGVYIPITAQSVTLQIGGFVIRPSTPAGQCVTWSVDVDADTNTLTVDLDSCETITAVVHVYDGGQEIYQTTLADITSGEAKYTGVDPDKDYLVVADIYVNGVLANTLKTWVSGSRTLALGWPSYYYELVAAAIILMSLLFSGAAFGWFGGLMAVLLAALFTYWGWIHVPYLLLALLGAIVLFGRRVS